MAKSLKEDGFIHLETSQILLRVAKKNTDFGQQLATLIKAGILVPDKTVCDSWLDEVRKFSNRRKPLVITGFPRTPGQAEFFSDQYLKLRPGRTVLLLEVDVNFDVALNRSRIRGRVDDGAFASRWNDWCEHSQSALKQLSTMLEVKVKKIDGQKSPEEIYSEVCGLIFQAEEINTVDA